MSDQQTKGAALPVALVSVPVLVLSLIFMILLVGGDNCGAGGAAVSIDPKSVPKTEIAGYGHEQLINAAYIVQAGKDLDLSSRDQTIGVMTAMGESSLRVLEYGDAVGPDSRGLFQQRDNWGPLADRLDPYKSAKLFFEALKKIPEGEREGLSPTLVAHAVQINADPNHYTKFWDAAVQVVEKLSGAKLTAGSCSTDGADGAVGKKGWAKPANPPINSPFGMRGGPYPNHTGTDFEADGCDGPIWAANKGRISDVSIDSLNNWIVDVDHGKGLITRYVHMYRSGILVRVGQEVKAGEQIAKTGSSGASTGCHLHFEVIVNGEFVDPIPFLAEREVTY